MASFIIPARCTIRAVNSALRAAGYGDVEIYYDPSNWQLVTAEYMCTDSNGHEYISPQRTMIRTAREWAEQFEREHF